MGLTIRRLWTRLAGTVFEASTGVLIVGLFCYYLPNQGRMVHFSYWHPLATRPWTGHDPRHVHGDLKARRNPEHNLDSVKGRLAGAAQYLV